MTRRLPNNQLFAQKNNMRKVKHPVHADKILGVEFFRDHPDALNRVAGIMAASSASSSASQNGEDGFHIV